MDKKRVVTSIHNIRCNLDDLYAEVSKFDESDKSEPKFKEGDVCWHKDEGLMTIIRQVE